MSVLWTRLALGLVLGFGVYAASMWAGRKRGAKPPTDYALKRDERASW